MVEVDSFGDIVNSLVTLRQNYHEQLKAIPQYEAYLLVASSTEKAAGALHASAGSSIATEVLDSLQFARNRFEQHLSSVPEYRVLLAIDRLIKEISIDLGVGRPASDVVVEQSKAPADHAATVGEHVAAIATELAAAVMAAQAVPQEAEHIALFAAGTGLPPASMVTPIDLDAEPIDMEEIVLVDAPRREAELAAPDQDLLDIVYRDVARAAEEAAGRPQPGQEGLAAASPPQQRIFDEDGGEAAA